LTVSPNAELTIDRFVYDPETELGEISVSAAAGAMRFIGGALSKKNPAVITTSISTIGIRGGVVDVFTAQNESTHAIFHYGEVMTMTNAQGVTALTTDAGSGLGQADAMSRPSALPQDIGQQRLDASPLRQALAVSTLAPQDLLDRLNQSSPITTSAVGADEVSIVTDEPSLSALDEATETDVAPQVEPPSTQDAAESIADDVTSEPLPDAMSAQENTASAVPDVDRSLATLLEDFPRGGPNMAAAVADLLVNAPEQLDALLAILPEANSNQAVAMGVGVVRVARIWAEQNPEAYKQLMQQLPEITNKDFKRSFNALSAQHVPQIGAHRMPPILPVAVISGVQVGQEMDSATLRRTLRQIDGDLPFVIRKDDEKLQRAMAKKAMNNDYEPLFDETSFSQALAAFVVYQATDNDAKPLSPIK
jgi:hypothetical protein